MRLCSIVLLASTAVSVCITGAPGVTNSSTKEAHISSSVPLVGDDSNNAPANRLLRMDDTTSGEERVPVPSALITTSLIQRKTELAVRKLYDGTKTPNFGLSKRAWRSVMNADSNLYKHMIAAEEEQRIKNLRVVASAKKKKKQQRIENEQVPKQTSNGETAAADLPDLVQAAITNHLPKEIELLPIMKWMTGQPSEQLVNVLRLHKVNKTFSYTKVRALTDVLEKYNKAMKTKIKLLDTLEGVYGGVASYARILSAAKLSGLTGEKIKTLQVELVESLHWETLDDLLVLLKLNLEHDYLTYEALDTIVVCVALRHKLTPEKALYVTLTGLRVKYHDDIVKDAITRGRGEVESANLHLVSKYGANPTILKEKEANRFADLLEAWLDPKTVVPSLTMNNRIRAAGTSLDEKSLELSLKPPGT
uniref:RxLR effector candidate protein n=1 Tax=Peronospora matthiolae TaxID=2874970 RepID=A0AAV1UDK5_9STRA